MSLLPAKRTFGPGGVERFTGAREKPQVPPAVQRVIENRAAPAGPGPYKGMTWGPPIKYVEIPPGEAGTRATLKIMKELVLSPWGHRNPEVVWLAKKIVKDVSPGPAKNYKAMVKAILAFMKKEVAYELDPSGLEYVQTPHYTLLTEGSGDCFVHGTRVLLRDGMRLVPIESVRKGDEIWGKGRWSTVERSWDKGILPTYKVLLNNGSSMRFTPDHKVWVARCPRHAHRKIKPCSCPVSERDIVVDSVENMEPGFVVLQPESIPFGVGEMDPDRAYIEGLYLADGWSEDRRFAISGQDGSPKEAVKKDLEKICSRLGVSTYMHRKYIRLNDPEWTDRVKLMGTHAPFKRALSLDLAEEPALRFLEGIMADSGKNTNGGGRTFTTTSRELWLQARVLLKMAGFTCGSMYVEDHGGLGRNPIHRLGIRCKSPSDGRAMKLLRIKEVVRDRVSLPCMDLTTDDHCVWLPEADWTVHQCDDQASAAAALGMALGLKAGFRTVRGDPSRPKQWSHVYAVIGVPDKGKTKWLTVDSTQAESHIGWDPPEAKALGMKTWVIDPSMERTTWHT